MQKVWLRFSGKKETDGTNPRSQLDMLLYFLRIPSFPSDHEDLSQTALLHSPSQSRMLPLREIVTTCQGMNLPLFRSALSAARWSPPQQGTSMRTMVTL